MTSDYEYKVVPAPARGVKARGVKTPEARFALAVETMMNEMAAERWEFLRSETLPSEERAGLASTATQWRTVMVFRRPRDRAEEAEAFHPRLLETPVTEPPAGPALAMGTALPVSGPQEPPLSASRSDADHAPEVASGPEDGPQPAPEPAQAVPTGPDEDLKAGPEDARPEEDTGAARP
jgi:hypothetical protein